MSRSRFNPLDQLICLEQLNSRFPSRWIEHVPCIMHLVGLLEPDVIVDLSAVDNALYLGCCQAIQSLKLDAKAFAIRPRHPIDDMDPDAPATPRSLEAPLYARFSRLLYATSLDAVSYFDPHSIDLLRIDGSRAVPLVARDFDAWLSRMSTYGLVLFDCVARRGGNLGVSELWDALSRRYPSFTFDHGAGLGALAVGVDAARVLESLVSADAGESARIRRFFASLGRMHRESTTAFHGRADDSSRLLVQTELQAERIRRLTAALRDCRRELAAAAEQQAIYDDRSASLTWRIADRASHAGARLAPRGSKRRRLLHAGFRVLRAGLRLGQRQHIERLMTTFAQRARHTRPGKLVGLVRDWLQAALECARFQWTIRSQPPSIPQFAGSRVSIVIPDAHQNTNMLACLNSILSNVTGMAFEVIAVQQGSTRQMLRPFGRIPGLVVAANRHNTGLGGCCNHGAAVATGEYLVFLRCAAAVTDGWLESLLETFDDLPGAGLVFPKLLEPDGRLKNAASLIEGETIGYQGDDPEHPRYNFVRELDSCSPTCMMIPKVLFGRIGGFDGEHVGAAAAAAALSLKVQRAGYKVVYQPAARIVDLEDRAREPAATSSIPKMGTIKGPHFRERLSEGTGPKHGAPGEVDSVESERVKRTPPYGKVLVIDYSLPTPDQDAGSVRIVEIVKAIRASENRVTFIPADLAHRTPYAQNLQRIGVEVVHQPFYSSVADYLERHGREFDVIILSRADVAARFLEPARRYAPRAKIIFDTVDLHFLREQRAAELLDSPRLRNAARRRKRQELALASQSDVTVVVSPVERAILERECPGTLVRVVPTVMDVPRDEPPGYVDRQHVVFIGGFSHPPNVDAVVYFALEILPLVLKQVPGLIFKVVGSNTPDQIRDLSGKNVHVMGFVREVKPILDQARVSVAPLRFGAGVKGKVNLSMAYGVPTVVSSIAAEGMHLVHELNAMIADGPAGFADALVRLYSSKELWERISANGRENVREHFSVESASRQIAGLLALAGLGDRMPSGGDVKRPSAGMIAG
jgi:glycosyltransferase involved in cell wall biosynthesis